MVLIETYLTLSIVTIALRIPHLLNGTIGNVAGDESSDGSGGVATDNLVSAFVADGNLSTLFNSTYVVDSTIREIAKSHVNLAVVVNTIFTLFILFGKVVQYFFFGKLREIEERNFRERFFLYVVTKFFIFAVKDHELISTLEWGFWFGIQCFLKLFSLLSRDRFEYLNTFSPNTHAKIHFKLLFLLVSILLSDLCCFYISTTRFFESGLSNILILNFEFFTIFFETIQTLVKYSIHLFDMSHTGVWEMRGQYVYFAEFATDSVILAGTCFHLIHIVIIQGMPTLLDLVLFSYFKGVFTELKRKVIGYRNYCKLVEDMENKYLNATDEELIKYNDDCAICRDKMETAKKLPCGHIFHHSCLRSWLEQQTSCPTCRRSLMELQTDQQEQSVAVNSDAEGIREMFPQIPLDYIIVDLAQTSSVQETINNILEGRIQAPPEPELSSSSNLIETPTSTRVQDNLNTINNNSNEDSNTTFNNNNSSSDDNIDKIESQSQNNDNNDNNNNNNNNNNSNICTNIDNNDNDNNTSQFFSNSKPVDKFADSFASSPEARQNSLMLRKKMMLEASRKLFLEEMDRDVVHNKGNKKS